MIYLVDYENVNLNGMVGIENLEETDHVIVFLGNNMGSIPFEWHIRILDSRAEVKYIKCGKVSKNYLDFQLATFCGYIMASLKQEKVFLVSKDKGFDSVVDFWSENKEDIQILRVESIDEGLGIPHPMNRNHNQKQKKNGNKTRGNRRNNGNRQHSAEAEAAVEIPAATEAEAVVEMPVTTESEIAEEVPVTTESEIAEEVPVTTEAEIPVEVPVIMETEVSAEADPMEIMMPVEEKKAAEAEVTVQEEETEMQSEAEIPAEEEEKALPGETHNKLSESTKKHIRQKIKDEQLKGGSYKTIYNIFINEKAKNRFNTALVKAFQQERGNRIYKKLLPEFEEHLKNQ